MLPFFDAYYDELQTCWREIEQIIDRLPAPALDWTPGPSMNSVTVLTTHLVGSTRYWIVDVACGRGAADRNREAEFATTARSGAQLKEGMDALLDEVNAALNQLTLDDLALARPAPLQGKRVSTGWALAHALAHLGAHLGHIQMTQQLWEERQPSA